MKIVLSQTDAGVEFKFSVPESVEEFNKASTPATVLDYAIDCIVRFDGLPSAWKKLEAKLREVHKDMIPLTKPHPVQTDKFVRIETCPKFVRRVMATKQLSVAAIQVYATELGNMPIDLTPRTPGAGGKTAGAIYLKQVATFRAAGILDIFIGKANVALGLKLTPTSSDVEIADAIRAYTNTTAVTSQLVPKVAKVEAPAASAKPAIPPKK